MVTVVDLRTRQKSLEFRLPGNQPVTGVKFSADGRTISIVTFEYPDGAAIFRRLDTSTGRRVLGPTRINRRGWSPLLITNDERRMVVVGDGEITLRDATTLSVLRRFPGIGPSASLTSLKNQAITGSSSYALSSDNHTLSFGTESGSLRLLDLRTGETRTAAGAHEAGVRDANFSPDGRQLVTTGEDGVVIVWNVRTAAAAETLRGHAGPVFSPQVTRNGATLFTASEDGTVFVWDLSGRRRLGRPFRIGAGPTSETVLSSDGRLLATSRLDGGAISIVETDTLERRKPIRFAGTGSALSIEFAPRSHRLVLGGRNGVLTVVDIDSRRVVGRLRGDDEDIFSGGISAAGGLLATTHGDNGVRLWSLPEKRQVGAPLRFGSAAVLAAEPSPDGRWLAIALLERSGRRSGSYRLEVWDARTRQVVHRVRLQEIAATAFSPDASLLAVAGNRDQARIWSTETWKPVTRSFTGHTAAITGLAISPDSRTLASGSFDGTVRLWDIDTEQAVGAPLPGLPNRSVQPVFAPDGAYLFAAHETGAAHRWDIRPEALVRQACRVAGRRLTRVEWAEFLPTRDYDPAC
jgi:WD40 repeat protein